jgi:hypothetical protein
LPASAVARVRQQQRAFAGNLHGDARIDVRRQPVDAPVAKMPAGAVSSRSSSSRPAKMVTFQAYQSGIANARSQPHAHAAERPEEEVRSG